MKIPLQVFPIEKSKRFQIINVEQHEISFPRINWAWFCVMAQLWFQTHRLNAALLWILHVLKWLSAQWSGSDCLLFFFVCLFWLDSFLQSGCERLLLCCGSLQGHREHEAEHGIIQTLTSLSFKNSKTLLWCSLLWTVMLPLQMLGSWL